MPVASLATNINKSNSNIIVNEKESGAIVKGRCVKTRRRRKFTETEREEYVLHIPRQMTL